MSSPRLQAQDGEITELRRWGGNRANDIAWSPDGRLLAIAANSIWLHSVDDLSNRELLAREYTQQANTLAWSPDSTQIAFGTLGGAIRVWDLANKKWLHILEGHTATVNSIAWSTDGTLLATASDDLTVRVWEMNRGKLLHTLEHANPVTSVTWSDATTLASGSYDGFVRIWNAVTGDQLLQIRGNSGSIFNIALSPDRTSLALAGEHALAVFNPASGEAVWRVGGRNNYVVWAPDGKRLATGMPDGRVRLWNVDTAERLYTSDKITEQVRRLAWRPDGQYLMLAGLDSVALMNATTGTIMNEMDQYTGAFSSAAWSPDGKKLVLGNINGTVQVGEISSGDILSMLEGHTGTVTSVAWAPNGERLVSASDDGTVRVWDANSGELLRVLKRHIGKVNAVAWSHDGTWLASAGDDGITVIWDVASGPLRILRCDAGPVYSVAWSPDDTTLAFGCNYGAVHVWSTLLGEPLNTLRGEGFAVKSLDWLSSSRLILGHANGAIQVRYAVDGNKNYEILRELNSSTGSVNSIAWSPDGTRFVVGSEDGTVQVWDAASGETVQEPVSHSGSVYNVNWSPDGTLIVSTGADGTARVWEVPGGWPMFPDLSDSTHTLWDPGQDPFPYM